MEPREPSQRGEQKREQQEASKTPEEANENIRTSQGDDATDPADARKARNKPAFDRDR